MKKCYFIIFIILGLISGCNPLKDVSKQNLKEKLNLQETTVETRTQSGDIIILPAPRTPDKVYRDTVVEYVTDKGSTVSTFYDKEGGITNQVIICPDSEETKQVTTKAEYEYKQRVVEKELNIEAINAIGKWLAITLIPIGFFFAIAYWLKSK